MHHRVPIHVSSAERRGGTRPVRWSGAPTAVDLVVTSFDAPLRLAQGLAWLAPWHQASVSGELPGPIPGLPPASAHLVEQVGVVPLLAAGALLSRQWRRRRLVAGEIVAGSARSPVYVGLNWGSPHFAKRSGNDLGWTTGPWDGSRLERDRQGAPWGSFGRIGRSRAGAAGTPIAGETS